MTGCRRRSGARSSPFVVLCLVFLQFWLIEFAARCLAFSDQLPRDANCNFATFVLVCNGMPMPLKEYETLQKRFGQN